MAIRASWANAEKTIIRQDYDGAWTWEEFFESSRQSSEMMATVSHRVDIVADMKPGTMPKSGTSITYARNVLRATPANWGILVIVGNAFVNAMVRVYGYVNNDMRAKIHVTESVEEAFELIEQERAKTK